MPTSDRRHSHPTSPDQELATGSWASSVAIRRTMQGCKSRDTKPELLLRSAVHSLGMRYRVAVRPMKEIRRSADLVFPREQLAVFLDGCFWHGCPDHFVAPRSNVAYWDQKISGNQVRDRETDALLLGAGWRVLRFWEHEAPAEASREVLDAVLEIRKERGLDTARLEARKPKG